MLVITRHEGERVLIRIPGVDQPIVLKIIKTGFDRVRLGFEADPQILINREELDLAKNCGGSG